MIVSHIHYCNEFCSCVVTVALKKNGYCVMIVNFLVILSCDTFDHMPIMLVSFTVHVSISITAKEITKYGNIIKLYGILDEKAIKIV